MHATWNIPLFMWWWDMTSSQPASHCTIHSPSLVNVKCHPRSTQRNIVHPRRRTFQFKCISPFRSCSCHCSRVRMVFSIKISGGRRSVFSAGAANNGLFIHSQSCQRRVPGLVAKGINIKSVTCYHWTAPLDDHILPRCCTGTSTINWWVTNTDLCAIKECLGPNESLTMYRFINLHYIHWMSSVCHTMT